MISLRQADGTTEPEGAEAQRINFAGRRPSTPPEKRGSGAVDGRHLGVKRGGPRVKETG